jgi:phosphoribosylanthranilate isomerase
MVFRLKRTVPVIKALRVRRSFRPAQLGRFKGAAAILLDAFDRLSRGGTGKTFNWAIARRAKRSGRIFLAGGLTPRNVAAAIHAARPYAVDVCSGVEATPRKKDAVRIQALMQAVRMEERRSR